MDLLSFGTYGLRPESKTKPNNKDCLFWHIAASKVVSDVGKVVLAIEPLPPC